MWLLAGVNPVIAAARQPTPQDLYQRCSKELHRCTKAHNATAETYADVLDLCWQETHDCPQVCVREYAERRRLGVAALDANPLYRGRGYEESSCIPGMDEIKHPGRKLLPPESTFLLTVTGQRQGEGVEALVNLQPLNAQGQAHLTEENPSRAAHYESHPLTFALPAGQYHVTVKPYGRSAKLRERSFRVALSKDQSVSRTISFALGSLYISAEKNGQPLKVRLYVAHKGSEPKLVEDYAPEHPLRLEPGIYTLNAIAPDGQKQRSDLVVEPGKARHQTLSFTRGRLRLVLPAQGTQISYKLWRMLDADRPSRGTPAVPQTTILLRSARLSEDTEIPLFPGHYRLATRHQQYSGETHIEDFVIHPGELVEKKVVLRQLGHLHVEVDGLQAAEKVGLNILSPGHNDSPDLSLGPQRPPFNVDLVPGHYAANLFIRYKSDIRGLPRVQPLADFEITSGQTVETRVTFPPPRWGTLKLNALFENQQVKYKFRISPREQPAYSVYETSSGRAGVKTPSEFGLLAGDYLVSVWGEEPKEPHEAIFPWPTFAKKDVAVKVEDRRVVEQVFRFKKQQPSKLVLKVLLNGSAVKARIKARISGSKNPFSAVGASYNFLTNKAKILPGNYDFSVQPLKIGVSLGVDVFHGRKGPLWETTPAKGTTPLILHNLHIEPNSTVEKTLSFKSNE